MNRNTCCREVIHRKLFIEELEARVAPATLYASNPTVEFIDPSGDGVRVQFGGVGQVDVLWVNGGAMPDPVDEIASITFAGTTAATSPGGSISSTR